MEHRFNRGWLVDARTGCTWFCTSGRPRGTDREPTEEEWAALKLGWSVVKHVKSNAIVVTDAQMTLGVGAGQMNRVGAAKIALEQAQKKHKVHHLLQMPFSL